MPSALNRWPAARRFILALALAVLLALSGCGSLQPLINQQTDETTTNAEAFSRLPGLNTHYGAIELLSGSAESPSYSPDRRGYLYQQDGWLYLHSEGSPQQRGYQHGWLLAGNIQEAIDQNSAMLKQLRAIDWAFLKEAALKMWSEQVTPEYQQELEAMVEGASERGATFDYGDLLTFNGLEELRDYWLPQHLNDYYASLPAGAGQGVSGMNDVQEAGEQAISEAGDLPPSETGEPASLPNPGDEATADKDVAFGDEDLAGADDPVYLGEQEANSGSAITLPALWPGATSSASLPNSEAATEAGASAPLSPDVSVDLGSLYRQSSAFIATGSLTTDGRIVLAHNSLAAYADTTFTNLIIDLVPDNGQHIVMSSQPGYIHALDQVYSSDSLVITQTAINGFVAYADGGVPAFCRIRQAVQYSTTLDEFIAALLAGNNGGMAASWLVGQLSSNEIMELELGQKFYNVEKSTDGCFVGSGLVDDRRIAEFETSGVQRNDIRLGASARQVRLLQLIEQNRGTIDNAVAKTIIADHFDVYLNKSKPSSRSVCAHYELDDAAYCAADPLAVPYLPYGSVDAHILSSQLAQDNQILGRWGAACGKSFNANTFLQQHRQYSYLEAYLYDRPNQPWTTLSPTTQPATEQAR
jgi:hypothetical protein